MCVTMTVCCVVSMCGAFNVSMFDCGMSFLCHRHAIFIRLNDKMCSLTDRSLTLITKLNLWLLVFIWYKINHRPVMWSLIGPPNRVPIVCMMWCSLYGHLSIGHFFASPCTATAIAYMAKIGATSHELLLLSPRGC